MAVSKAKAKDRDVEGVGRVVVGVVLTVGLWACLAPFGSLAIAVSPPFTLAVVVALAGRAMRWGRRTASASVLVLAATLIVSDVFYLRDRGRLWTIWFVALFNVLAVGVTWLAWKGGIMISQQRAGEPRTSGHR